MQNLQDINFYKFVHNTINTTLNKIINSIVIYVNLLFKVGIKFEVLILIG